MDEVLEMFAIGQFIVEAIRFLCGTKLCIGALKWRKGTLSTTAALWGAVLGLYLGTTVMMSGDGDLGALVAFTVFGALIFWILTYTIAGVNRFVLGFIFGSKLVGMITTVMLKDGTIDLLTSLYAPLVAGTIIGLVLMAWLNMRVLPIILCSTFIGAGEIAPIISEWVNRGGFIVTGDLSYLFDPMDTLFSFIGIELTDEITLVAMIILLVIGTSLQLSSLKKQNIAFSTPVIGFEIPGSEK